MAEEEIQAPAGPAGGPNRTFLLLAGGLLVPMIGALILFGAVVLPKLTQPQGAGNTAVQTATAAAAQTQVALAQQTQQASATPRPTATPTRVVPTPTRVGPTNTPVGQQGVTPTDTPVVSRNKTPTPIKGAGQPTPTRVGGGGLPPGGISSETGGPLILVAGLGLLAVLIVARRLRTS